MTHKEHFAAVPEELIRSGASPRAIQIYGLLKRYAGEDRIAWPHQSTLAKDLGCSRQTISRAVTELREAGWIKVKRRGLAPGVWYHLYETPQPCKNPVSDDSKVSHGHDSKVSHPYEVEPIEPEPEEKNTSCSPPPPRTAVRRTAKLARDREDALDPAKALDLWDAPAAAHAPAPRRTPSAQSPMGLALAWRARMQEARVAGALDTNVKALARTFRVLLQEGTTAEQIRAMTELYANVPGLRHASAAPWRHFLYQRHLLLSKVRDAERDRLVREDPDAAYAYTPPTREQLRELDRAFLVG